MRKSWLISYLLLGVTWGLSFLFIKQGLEFLTPLGVAFGRCSLGALTLIIIAKAKRVELPRDPKIWGHLLVVALFLSMLALGIFGSGVAYIWNFEIIRAAGSAIASSVTFVTPVVAVIAGIIFLGESITWYEPLGALIVLFGAAVAQERIKLFSRA